MTLGVRTLPPRLTPWIQETHLVEGENGLLQIVLRPPHVPHVGAPLPHTKQINVFFQKKKIVEQETYELLGNVLATFLCLC